MLWYPLRMKRAALLLGVISFALPAVVSAAAPGGSTDDNLVSYDPGPTERRGGFAVGATSGLSLLHFAGYPNRAADIGDPEKLEDSGPVLGNGFNLWIGGALRDWLTIGLGIAGSSALTGNYQATAVGFVLHLEGYPFYALGNSFRDWGFAVDGGPGVAVMFAADDKELANPLAEGGASSFLALGTFYEPFRFWHFSTGPSLTFSQTYSQTLTATQGMLGWRFVFYGDQPKQAPRAAAGEASRQRAF